MPIKRDFFDVSGFETENFHCQPDKQYKDSRDPPKKGFFDDSECFPKIWPEVAIKDIVSAQTYQPATTTVDKYFLLDCKESLEAGLEFTQAALAEHDASLGRTTFKNKSWAETMEKSIAQMRSCVQRIDGFLAKF